MAVKLLDRDEELLLIAKAQAGDNAAAERLLEAYEPLVRSEVRKFMRGRRAPKTPEEVAHEVRACLWEAIQAFDATNGARLGRLAKTIIARRLPRQVYQRPSRSDALSRVKPSEEFRESGLTATLPRPLTHAQQAALIEIANVLRQVRKVALTHAQQNLIRAHYDYGYNVAESAPGLSRSLLNLGERGGRKFILTVLDRVNTESTMLWGVSR